ncbi:winged helix DNA-binding domain-containing protein [Marinomonas sp. C2222]|uniref:Winged helix DNA-binding domain-containing protein n=1 Tax=Marinomonas sargassi TaxID=2984494 RepID=A0ABT2YTL6_9GAMM|nr:crosslink repair DNA glycosylase YcaQ family protein [Marinomonas sargassi]MCV2403253.1 winged helix DNA-binding domain-containing protein [Marinomonas sargassi]
MRKITSSKDLARIRRIALAAQGLLQTQAYGRGLSGARKAIQHIGYVQIDTISVVERAHHHVLHSRVPNYQPDMLNQMLVAGDIFEYWSHAAAFLPMEDFRFSLPFKEATKSGQHPWYKNKDQKLMNELLARIRSDGPLRSRDIENKPTTSSGWWDWKPAKQALDQLYMEGDLMVCDRTGFQKTYDLAERVLPSHINTAMPTNEEFAEHLLQQQLACHGLVSLKGVTYLRRNAELRKAVKNLIHERLLQGSLEQIQLPNDEVFFIEVSTLESTLPRLNEKLRILSPFDNSVIQRDRLRPLFQFDYQIECYLPAAKRQYGYFSLPLLYRAEMIGRMDCKAHRKTGHLEIKCLHFEEHLSSARSGYEESLIAAFTEAVKTFCVFQKCDTVSLNAVHPKRLLQPIQKLLF